MIPYLLATNLKFPLFSLKNLDLYLTIIYTGIYLFCVSAKRFSYIHQNQIQGYENLSPSLLLNNPSYRKNDTKNSCYFTLHL